MALEEHWRQTLTDMKSKVDETHTSVTTLVERSAQQEKRMNRSDRRAGLIAGVVGTAIASIGAFFRGN